MRLAEIKGQDRAVSALRRDFSTGRMAPSYLFVGPEGVGKTTTAIAFAGLLFCKEGARGGESEDACGVCDACRKVRTESHPDLMVVRRDGRFIKVGEFEKDRKRGEPPQIRQLIAAAQRKPYEGPVKVLVVDEAHRMNASAANALLKTLEEPPPGTVIILTAAMLGALPQTVVSRCRVIRFRKLERSWLASEVERLRGRSAEEARLVASFADGRMDHALEADPEEVFARRTKALDLLEAALEGRTAAALKNVSGVGRPAEEAEALLDVFMSLVRDVRAVRGGAEPGFLVHEDLANELARHGSAYTNKALEDLFDRARSLRADIRLKNANPQLGWESLLLTPKKPAAVGG